MGRRFYVRPRDTGPQVPAQVQGLNATAASSSEIDLAWTAIVGATAYTVRRFGVAIATVGSNSYINTGLTANTTYSYTVSAINAYGEGSQSIPASAHTAAGATVRFNPGHYLCRDGYNPTTTQVQSLINSAPSICKGIQVGITWAQMESTQGNYTNGIAYVQSLLNLAAAAETARGTPFKLVLYINSDTASVSPSYIQNAGFDGGLGTYVPPAPSNRVPCFWRTSIQDALIARDIAYLDAFNSHPNFEMLGGPKGETDTTYNVTAGPGYSDTNYQACFTRWIAACRPHAPNAQLRIIANFLPGNWTAMDSLIQTCIANRIAMGGPDVYTRFVTPAQPYPATFTLVANGWTNKTGTWQADGTNYVAQNKLCMVHDAQTPEMGGKENGSASPDGDGLQQQAVFNGDNYLIWWWHQVCWVAPYNSKRQLYGDNATALTTATDGSVELNGHFSPDIKTLLATAAASLNSNVPLYYQ